MKTAIYLGMLFLVSCFIHSVARACTDCGCCYQTNQQCLSACVDPFDCTDCVNKKDDCELQNGCNKKRGFEGWKTKTHKGVALLQDEKEDLPFNEKRVASRKYLLDDFLTKRGKKRQH